jgi:hypothetical protein
MNNFSFTLFTQFVLKFKALISPFEFEFEIEKFQYLSCLLGVKIVKKFISFGPSPLSQTVSIYPADANIDTFFQRNSADFFSRFKTFLCLFLTSE